MRTYQHLFLALICAAGLAPLASAEPTWTPTGNLNVARHFHTATLLQDGRVLVAGGRGAGRASLDSAELYDPQTGAWTLTSPMGVSRTFHSATLLADGRVLVAGGDTEAAAPDFGRTSTAELFDPSTGSWTPAATLLIRRSGHTATILANGTVLVAGGYVADTLGTAELYDPATGSWRSTGPLRQPRFWHTATRLDDGSVLIVGGSDDGDLGSTLAGAERYDPAAGTWSVIADRPRGSVLHTQTLLADGRVLVTGGYDLPPSSQVRAEILDPAVGWSRAGDIPSARDGHTATLLPDGSVLIAGGNVWSGGIPRLAVATRGDSHLFRADGAGWDAAAPLNAPRKNHTATLLRDGRVLVAGGYASGGYPNRPGRYTNTELDSAELYGPGIDDCKNHYILARPCDARQPARRR